MKYDRTFHIYTDVDFTLLDTYQALMDHIGEFTTEPDLRHFVEPFRPSGKNPDMYLHDKIKLELYAMNPRYRKERIITRVLRLYERFGESLTIVSKRHITNIYSVLPEFEGISKFVHLDDTERCFYVRSRGPFIHFDDKLDVAHCLAYSKYPGLVVLVSPKEDKIDKLIKITPKI